MKRLLFYVFAATGLWGAINQNNDVQFWLTEMVHKELSPKATVYLSNEWRFGDNVSQLYFFYLQGMATFALNEQWAMGSGYRQIWHLRQAKWRLDEEPFFDLLFSKAKGKLTFLVRNRFSYIFRESLRDVWAYRGRVRWIYSWEIRERIFQSYLSNEIFLLSHYGFTQDRLMTGIIIPLFSHLSGDFYYMLRFLKRGGSWTHQNVFGVWFNLYF